MCFLLKHDLILIAAIYWEFTFTRHKAKDLTSFTLFLLVLTRVLWNRYHLTEEVSGPKEIKCLPQGHMGVTGNAGAWVEASDFRASSWTANLRPNCQQRPCQPSPLHVNHNSTASLLRNVFSQSSPSKFSHDFGNVCFIHESVAYLQLYCLSNTFPHPCISVKLGENQYFTEENTDHKVLWWEPRNRSKDSCAFLLSLVTLGNAPFTLFSLVFKYNSLKTPGRFIDICAPAGVYSLYSFSSSSSWHDDLYSPFRGAVGKPLAPPR